jgi:hypothetical protein
MTAILTYCRSNPNTIHDKFLVHYRASMCDLIFHHSFPSVSFPLKSFIARRMVLDHWCLMVRRVITLFTYSLLMVSLQGAQKWSSWFSSSSNLPSGRPNIDLWPDTSEYSSSERYPIPFLTDANGDQSFLFSSQNANTVRKHVRWMAMHGVDGCFLERALAEFGVNEHRSNVKNIRDNTLRTVLEACKNEGRVFSIT